VTRHLSVLTFPLIRRPGSGPVGTHYSYGEEINITSYLHWVPRMHGHTLGSTSGYFRLLDRVHRLAALSTSSIYCHRHRLLLDRLLDWVITTWIDYRHWLLSTGTEWITTPRSTLGSTLFIECLYTWLALTLGHRHLASSSIIDCINTWVDYIDYRHWVLAHLDLLLAIGRKMEEEDMFLFTLRFFQSWCASRLDHYLPTHPNPRGERTSMHNYIYNISNWWRPSPVVESSLPHP